MKKTAIVTDLKVVDSPQAGLGVGRCLKEAGFNVIGVDDTPFTTHNPDIFKKVFCWEEIRTLNFESLLKKISDIQKMYGLDYIFPCYDETIILFSFIKDRLESLGIELVAPSLATIKSIQKLNLSKLFDEFNSDKYKTPATKLVNSLNDALNFAKEISYPVICKGKTKGAYFCENNEDINTNLLRIAKIWNNGEIDCLIQKHIQGKYKNCIAAIKNNKIVGYVEMTKMGLDQNGATWFGKIEKSRDIFELAEYVVKSLSFGTAIIEIETIKSDENYFTYEINPRCPGWIYAPCQLELNLPALITKNFNEKIEFIKNEGYFGRESIDFIRDLKDIKNFENSFYFYSKGAAYKSKNLKYPSDLL